MENGALSTILWMKYRNGNFVILRFLLLNKRFSPPVLSLRNRRQGEVNLLMALLLPPVVYLESDGIIQTFRPSKAQHARSLGQREVGRRLVWRELKHLSLGVQKLLRPVRDAPRGLFLSLNTFSSSWAEMLTSLTPGLQWRYLVHNKM